MASNFGKTIQVATFGASHGYAIGGIVEGLPCGHTIDIDELQAFLKRRAPGQNQLQTQRKEADIPEFLSGMVDGMLSGSPLAFMIRNTSQHSGDYNNLRDIPRPSHADRERASRKDNADYGRIIVWKFVVRHNLAISIQFANATGYELCVLM